MLSQWGLKDRSKLDKAKNELERLRPKFGKKVNELLQGIVMSIGIPNNSNMDGLIAALKSLPDATKDELRELFLSDPDIKGFLDKVAVADFEGIEGRSRIFAENILKSAKKDSAFLVGSLHVKGLKSYLDEAGKYNVFILAPKEMTDGDVNSYPVGVELQRFREDADYDFLKSVGLERDGYVSLKDGATF